MRGKCRRSRPYLASRAASLAAAALSLSTPCVAEITAFNTLTGQYQYNSDVFALQSGVNPTIGSENNQRGDFYYAYGAASAIKDGLGPQQLFLNLSCNEFRYDHFTQLDHLEYNIDGGLNWKLGDELDGKLEVARSRIMVTFLDLTQTQFVNQLQLALQTEQRESVLVGFLVTPDWRLETNAYTRGVDEPLQATPNLHLTETFGSFAVKYIARAGLTAGITAGYLSGSYTGVSAAAEPAYHQDNVDLVANYQATGRTTLAAEAGYTDRKSADGINSLSGFTGLLDYKNQLTPKTSLDLQLNRALNSFIANAGSEIDTTASLNILWQATYKLGVNLMYQFGERDYPSQGPTPGSDRLDHTSLVSLKIDYRPLRWLVIAPYVNVQTRHSNVDNAAYSANIYGVNLIVQSRQ